MNMADIKTRTAYSKVFLPEMIRRAATNHHVLTQQERDMNTILEFNQSRGE